MSGFYKCWLNFNGKLLERLAGMQCQKHTYWPRMIFLFYRAMRVWILGVLETAAVHHYVKQLTLSGVVSWDAALSPWSWPPHTLELLNLCCVRAVHKPLWASKPHVKQGRSHCHSCLCLVFQLHYLWVLVYKANFTFILLFIILPDIVAFERLRKKHIWRTHY